MMQEARSFGNDLWEVACCPSGVHPLGWGPGVDRRVLMLLGGWETAQAASCTDTTHPRLTQHECGSPCFGHTLSPVLEKVPLAQPKATLSWMKRVNPGVDSPLPPAGFRSTPQGTRGQNPQGVRGQTLFISRTKMLPHPKKHLEKKQPAAPSVHVSDHNTQHQALEGVRLSKKGEDRDGREKAEGHGQKSG